MWELVKNDKGKCDQKLFLTPMAYLEGETLMTNDEVCGFEFQVTNKSDKTGYNFMFLREEAIQLQVAAVSLAASTLGLYLF